MNISVYNQNIFFKSNIDIVDSDKFDRKLDCLTSKYPNKDKLNQSGSPYGLDNMVESDEYAFTQRASICNVIGITNGKKVVLSHLNPLNTQVKDQDLLESKLREKISELKAGNNELRAIIAGGLVIGKNDKNRKDYKDRRKLSSELYARLKRVLKECGIPTTIIWGHLGNSNSHNDDSKPVLTDVLYSVDDDTWYISCKDKDINSEDALKKAYRFVKMADGDELSIKGNPVDKTAHC